MQLYLRKRMEQLDYLEISVRLITLSSMPQDMKSVGNTINDQNLPGEILLPRNNFTGIIDLAEVTDLVLNDNEDGLMSYNEYNSVYPFVEVIFKNSYSPDPEVGVYDLYQYGDDEMLKLKIPNNINEVRDALHTDGAHNIYYLLEIIDDPMLKDTTKQIVKVGEGAPFRRRRDALTIGRSWGPDNVYLPYEARRSMIRSMEQRKDDFRGGAR